MNGLPGDEPPRSPLWLRPFFGEERVPPAAMRTLLLVSLGIFFENYDIGLLSAALPQIAEGLGIEQANTGFYLAAIRFGGIATILFMALADRQGRRRVFLGCFVAMSLGTAATALAQTPLEFAAAQMITRVFMLTASSLALVILVEEFPATLRGGAIGVLSLLGGMGFGLGAGLYAAVDLLPFGWRSLYAVGLVPVLLLPFFRRALQETARFERHQESERARGVPSALGMFSWVKPVGLLFRRHPGRASIVGVAGLFSAMGSINLAQYSSLYLREVHGWAPGHYSLLILCGGMLAVLGNVLGGRGSDLIGRRRVGLIAYFCAPPLMWLFFQVAENPIALGLSWGLASMFIVAGSLIVRAVTTELFPTSHRSTAAGWLIAVETLGWSSGLLLVSLLNESGADGADIAGSVARIGAVIAISGLALALVPETGGRELEEIASD